MTLRVRLEMVPHGDESRVREIGRMDIYNDRDLDKEFCAYRVVGHGDKEVYHKRKYGAWELVRKIIDELKITGPT